MIGFDCDTGVWAKVLQFTAAVQKIIDSRIDLMLIVSGTKKLTHKSLSL